MATRYGFMPCTTAGKCYDCKKELQVGDDIVYDNAVRRRLCRPCAFKQIDEHYGGNKSKMSVQEPVKRGRKPQPKEVSFGDSFECDRDGVKCFKCKKPIQKGEPLIFEFNERKRWCVYCVAESSEQQNEAESQSESSPPPELEKQLTELQRRFDEFSKFVIDELDWFRSELGSRPRRIVPFQPEPVVDAFAD